MWQIAVIILLTLLIISAVFVYFTVNSVELILADRGTFNGNGSYKKVIVNVFDTRSKTLDATITDSSNSTMRYLGTYSLDGTNAILLKTGYFTGRLELTKISPLGNHEMTLKTTFPKATSTVFTLVA